MSFFFTGFFTSGKGSSLVQKDQVGGEGEGYGGRERKRERECALEWAMTK